MRFFTPDLLQQFNSPDPKRAADANEAWERAIVEYRRKLKRIRARLPEPVRGYLDEYCLHDAEVLGLVRSSAPVLTCSFKVVWLFIRQGDRFSVLKYHLTKDPVVEYPVFPESMCSEQARWLYDELDVLDREGFSHEILLSNGFLIRIVFSEFETVTGEVLPVDRKWMQESLATA